METKFTVITPEKQNDEPTFKRGDIIMQNGKYCMIMTKLLPNKSDYCVTLCELELGWDAAPAGGVIVGDWDEITLDELSKFGGYIKIPPKGTKIIIEVE